MTPVTLQPGDFEGVNEAVAQLVPDLVASCSRFLPDGLAKSEGFRESFQQGMFFTISKGRRKEDLAAAIRSFLPRKIDEMLKGIGSAAGGEIGRLQYLGPLRSYPPRHLAFAQHHDPNWYAGGGYAWDVVRRDAHVRNLVNEWLSSTERLQTPYEIAVQELLPEVLLNQEIPEKLAKSWHDLLVRFLRESAEGGGEGDSISIIVHELLGDIPYDSNETIPDIEQIVSRLSSSEDIVARWSELLLRNRLDPLQELVLLDKRSGTPVSHRDVGIGISQVLPVLVGAYASEDRVIAIEQPEIHLHPALQADLADVFILSALGQTKNTFVIETHSEHLLLRIMRRMRETSDGELSKECLPVTPKDVSVLFVQSKGASSVVRHLELDEEGQLLDVWPGGFFEEGYRERFA